MIWGGGSLRTQEGGTSDKCARIYARKQSEDQVALSGEHNPQQLYIDS